MARTLVFPAAPGGALCHSLLDLVDNSGLQDGDLVSLSFNPLSELSRTTHIPALQARGVTVTW